MVGKSRATQHISRSSVRAAGGRSTRVIGDALRTSRVSRDRTSHGSVGIAGATRHDSRYSSAGGHGSGFGLTIGAVGDHFAGYVRLGNGSSGHGLEGGILYRGNNDHYRGGYGGHHYYPFHDDYYTDYHSIAYHYPFYRPTYGYTYSSVYYADPYTYCFGYADPYLSDPAAYWEAPYGPPDVVAVGPPAPVTQYQGLTAPGDDTLVGRGNAAYRAGRFDEARRLYVSAMLTDERDGHAKLLYAIANLAVGDYSVAGTALRRALLTTESLVEYPPDLRGLYPDVSVLARHESALKRYVFANPSDRASRVLLGYLLFSSGDPGGAAVVFENLAREDSDDDLAALLRDAARRMRRQQDDRQ